MTVTQAIVQGLELLFRGNTEIGLTDILEHNDNQILNLQEQIKVKDTQIEQLHTTIHELSDTMKAQAVHMQTLINQKAIEAPGAKKPQERRSPGGNFGNIENVKKVKKQNSQKQSQ